MKSQGSYKGKPLEKMSRDELMRALAEMINLHLWLIEKHRKDMDYLREVL